MPTPDITNFIPKYLNIVVADRSRLIVTSQHWNELWNLSIEQNDWNASAIAQICEALKLQASKIYVDGLIANVRSEATELLARINQQDAIIVNLTARIQFLEATLGIVHFA
jgi:hypothetical protein